MIYFSHLVSFHAPSPPLVFTRHNHFRYTVMQAHERIKHPLKRAKFIRFFYFRSSLTRGGCVMAVSEIAPVKTLDLKKGNTCFCYLYFVTCILYLNFVWRVYRDIFMYSFAWGMHVNIMDVIVLRWFVRFYYFGSGKRIACVLCHRL